MRPCAHVQLCCYPLLIFATSAVVDLPGTYSLAPQSVDEQVSRDVLLNRLPELPPPDLIVVVVDASNLQRNLYYATQVIELGYPTLLALNMVDVAEQNGNTIDAAALSRDPAPRPPGPAGETPSAGRWPSGAGTCRT